jgi:LacI family transcriptional regulator
MSGVPGSRVTIRDVAAQAGVSVATVSKVLNDRYGVASETSARVREVIAELGYEASLVAQSLRNSRTDVIGILVADLEPFSAELLKGAGDAIRHTDYELVVYSAGGHARDHVGWERRYLTRLSGTLIDGAVLVTPTVVDAGHGTPVVAVDPHAGPTDLPTIDSDNLGGARTAVEYLIGLGHRRIGFVAGRSDLQSAMLRETGYRRALAEAGIPVDERLLVEGQYDAEVTAAVVGQLLTAGERPTAMFAANDVSALAILEVARTLGLRVPRDLSVIGFDNIPESALCTPPLTTVEQPIREMGHRAVDLLITLIRGERPERVHVTLDTRLVVRASCGAREPA